MREHIREGSARQAIVTADLLRRNFEVWQEVGNSSVDLIACKFGLLLRIEVKGNKKRNISKNNAPVGAVSGSVDCRRFDIVAVVSNHSVRYVRSILHQVNNASIELIHEETINVSTRKDYIARQANMAKESK
jgi:hypothetical protein